jgi:hypothetical protein
MQKTSFFKALSITALSVVFLGFNSCSKLKSLLQFDLNMQTASFQISIPPATTSDSIPATTVTILFNVDSFVKAGTSNQLDISNLTVAKINSCILTLSNPDSANNFANLQTTTLQFYTDSMSTPYTIGNINNNPDKYSTSLTMPVDTSANLSTYLHATKFVYSIAGKLRRSTTDTLKCSVQTTFTLHVQG